MSSAPSARPGRLPELLPHAAWDAADAPGSTVTTGADTSGRTGEVLKRTGTEAPVRLVRDRDGPAARAGTGSIVAIYTVQEFTGTIPPELTLEMTGCTTWASC